MSAVLDIDNLLESPLADLHALAGELDIEGYRLLKKPDLTIAILEARGATEDEIRPAVEAKASELAEIKAERERQLAEQERLEEEAREAAAAERAARQPRQQRGERGERSERGGRGQRGGRGRGGRGGERRPREREGAKAEAAPAKGKGRERKEQAPRADEPTVAISGVFEPGSGGGGRLRTDLTRRVRGDADVPRGEVRRWNLRRGDIINAQAKKARRGRTDYVIASIADVNGQNAEQRKQKTPSFDELAAAGIEGRFAKKLFKHAPVGSGSRVVVTGPTRAVASEMTEKLAGELASDGVITTLIVVQARPVAPAPAGGYELVVAQEGKAPDDILPTLELVLDRDRRLAEAGRNAAVLVDGLDLLAADTANEIFNAARNLTQGGSLTIVASAGAGSPLEAQATSIGVVAGGRRLKLDKKASWSQDR